MVNQRPQPAAAAGTHSQLATLFVLAGDHMTELDLGQHECTMPPPTALASHATSDNVRPIV